MEKKILPRATKTSLVKLLRAKGYDVPSIRQVDLDQTVLIIDRHPRIFCLHWRDKEGTHHWAYYGWGGGPTLRVDETEIELTWEEVRRFGLYKEKKIPHDCEGSHTGSVLKEYNKDMFILAQENEFGKGVAEKT